MTKKLLIRASVSIDNKPLTQNEFASVNIQQMVGQHHSFEIRLPQGEVDRELKRGLEWIGKPVSIGFDYKENEQIDQSAVKERFKGIITSVSLSRETNESEWVVSGYSPTIMADGGPQTKSFTDKNLKQIVDEVLGEYSKLSSAEVQPNYEDSLPYTVQYEESDFRFLSRLASVFGEWFYYDGLKLCFAKPKATNQKDKIKLDFGKNGFSQFNVSIQVAPVQQEYRAYDYKVHKVHDVESPGNSATSETGKKAVTVSKEVYSQKPLQTISQVTLEPELKRLAKRNEEVAVDEMVTVSGSGRNPNLRVGALIDIRNTDSHSNYGSYTITSVSHTILQGGNYWNSFQAIPEEVKPAPLVSIPEPPFCETQLAEVTNVDDEEGLGRVKVRFLWQEENETSPWLRVASPYTGKEKGFYIVPEVGDQVLVAFENNNADFPYVLSGMYNGEAKPEWFHKKNQFKGFKSAGGNKWKFDDIKKEIQIHAPTSILQTAGEKIEIRAGEKEKDSSIVMNGEKEIIISTDKSSGSRITLDAGEGTIELKAKNINLIASDSVDVKADKKITQSGQTKVEITSKDVKIEGSTKLSANGNKIEIKGGSLIEAKAGVIKLN